MRPTTPVPNAKKGSPYELIDDQVMITGLTPGRRYLIKLKPVTSANAEYEDPTLKADFEAYTSCSCDSGGSEDTGMPSDLDATQANGLVRLSFTDKSACDEAFAITRQLVARGDGVAVPELEPVVAFAPSYFFYSTEPCNERVTPGSEFSDVVKNLEGEECANPLSTSHDPLKY